MTIYQTSVGWVCGVLDTEQGYQSDPRYGSHCRARWALHVAWTMPLTEVEFQNGSDRRVFPDSMHHKVKEPKMLVHLAVEDRGS